MDIIIKHNNDAYTNLIIGSTEEAVDGIDRYDFRMPRSLPGMFSAYFHRPEWDEDYPDFASDIRTSSEELQDWPFNIIGKRGDEIRFNFSGWEDLDPEKDIFLVDLVSLHSQNIREKPA